MLKYKAQCRRPRAIGERFVRIYAIEIHTDMSQKQFYAEIYR
jgi:hypothetical protein